jgi:hypothetical protein
VGKVVQPLQSVNCHDNCAHSHEQYEPFTRLVGFGWVGSVGFDSSWSISGYAEVRSLCAWFGYRWNACERWSVLATRVPHVSLRPLITVGNLGAWSCLDIV